MPARPVLRSAALATCLALAAAQTDECTINLGINAQACALATPAQQCLDPSFFVNNNWVCQCVMPYTGPPGPAAPSAACVLNECTTSRGAECPNCPNTPGNPPGSICTAQPAGAPAQSCEDADQTALNTWTCVCRPSYNGAGNQAPATCTINECSNTCPHCAGTACVDNGQICMDPSVSVRDDWFCECAYPYEGTRTGAAVVLCSIDECAYSLAHGCMTCAGTTCRDVGQDCVEPNIERWGDWQCECRDPYTGANPLGEALCIIDECTETCLSCANNVCSGQMQACIEPDVAVANNWICQCPPPSSGSAIATVASCEYDECIVNNNVCAALAQTCTDPDLSTTRGGSGRGDWLCTCPAPSTGSEIAAAAACEINECEVTVGSGCPNCENDLCAAAVPNPQTCTDPNVDSASLNDWYCTCPWPSSGQQVTAIAACDLNECFISVCPTCAQTTCSDAMPTPQACDDPVPMATSLSDWTCTCPEPSSGVGVTAAATCTLDECTATCAFCQGTTCTDVGQVCTDPDIAYTSIRDWTCTCVAPGVGQQSVAKATCALDECAVVGCGSCEDGLCATDGQICNDPQPYGDGIGDWYCSCTPPALGTPTLVALADCVIDECIRACPTCAGSTCSDAGQACDDLDTHPSALSDWTCTCPPPSTGQNTAAVAACVMDECVAPCAICNLNSCESSNPPQLCNDPDISADSPRDWTCTCVPPLTGAFTGGAASCDLNECEAACPTCEIDACSFAGQTCVDADLQPSSTLDWQCICVAPEVGASTVAPAACELDECFVDDPACVTCAFGVCLAAGQRCVDPDTSARRFNDWYCECLSPFQGAGLTGVADCEIDECAAACRTCSGGTCAGRDQDCVDPDTSGGSLSDWVCVCKAPYTGNSTRRASPCSIDECLADQSVCPTCAGDTCSAALQLCTDPDLRDNALRDWTCSCPPPTTGSEVGMPAACVIDECQTACPTCNNGVCEAALQDCTDPDTSDVHLSDWRCICRAPLSGEAEAGASPCQLNECLLTCLTCAGTTCSDAGQWCSDPNDDSTSLGDWTCTCVIPYSTGAAVARAAECVIDECRADCPSCDAGICAGALQDCDDPDNRASKLSDWTCNCRAPLTGAPVEHQPADCVLDECTASCPTCAGAQCVVVNQDCRDPDTAPTSRADWMCECRAPAFGLQEAGAADCRLDECRVVDPSCGTCENGACGAAGQLCEDPAPFTRSLRDWECQCRLPATETRVLGPATCTVDECTETDIYCVSCAKATCSDKGETCHDPDTSAGSLWDWSCTCPAPFTGTAVATYAQCALDECRPELTYMECHSCARDTCSAVQQACSDPNQRREVVGDWTCTCPPPQVGQAVAAAAACTVDECAEPGCATCAKETCSMLNQTCRDPDARAESLLDWICTCPLPTKGSAVAAFADCSLDECRDHCDTCAEQTCSAQGQACADPYPDALTLSDWTCSCKAPTTGTAVAAAATCGIDECATTCASCENGACSGGQTCDDPNTDDTHLHDWTCTCPAPTVGQAKGERATCTLDECHAACATCANSTCFHAGQDCDDMDMRDTAVGDWVCHCAVPQVGSAIATVADCHLDECLEGCHTCANKTCADVTQTCRDPNKHATSLSDWTCTCRLPFSGAYTAGAAECIIDECLENNCASCAKDACTSKGQRCHDADLSEYSLHDWTCTCLEEKTGSAVGETAQCVIDECDELHAACATCARGACERVGQACVDVNTAAESLRDWQCRCREPTQGSAVGFPVPRCFLDECAETHPLCTTCALDTCTAVHQSCEDPTPTTEALSDWECVCPLPSRGREVATLAHCVLDECAERTCRTCELGTCARMEQDCRDPDTHYNSTSDWMCFCRAPTVNEAAAVGVPAVCLLDECAPHELALCPTCAGTTCTAKAQTCVDPAPRAESLRDWVCGCPLPSRSVAVANYAECRLDECTEMSATCLTCAKELCTDLKQRCVDPNQDLLVTSDWVCTCPSPSIGQATARAADCIIDECEFNCAECERDRCLDAGQDCVEPNDSALSLYDWYCRCRYPSIGRAVTRVAACVLNECNATIPCATCANQTCAAVGQLCHDPNTLDESLLDWSCNCAPPKQGMAVAAPFPLCQLDECADTCATCSNGLCDNAGQDCLDPNATEFALEDWRCACRGPGHGFAISALAMCEINECFEETLACVTCEKGLCDIHDQTCVDPNHAVDALGDWFCKCRHPFQGTKTADPAECFLDECGAGCPTCANDACAHPHHNYNDLVQPNITGYPTLQQRCRDPNTAMDSLSDWMCECVAPAAGAPSPQEYAACEFDECTVHEVNMVCEMKRQKCRDAEKAVTSMGDWQCLCVEQHMYGSAVARAAHCTFSPTDMPATPTPGTDVPDTRVPKTHVPLTDVPYTSSPRDASHKERVSSPGPPVNLPELMSAAAALMPIANPCHLHTGHARHDKLPFLYHPTQLEIGGSLPLGAVVGNFLVLAFIVVVALAAAIALRMATKTPAEYQRVCVGDSYGLLQFPSVFLVFLHWFYPATTLSAFQCMFYGAPSHAVMAGVAQVALVLAPFHVLPRVRKNVPATAMYVNDEECTTWSEAFMLGPGEWVAPQPEKLFLFKYAGVMRPYRESQCNFYGVEKALMLLLSCTAALEPETWAGCGHVKIAQALALLAFVVLTAFKMPYHRPRDNYFKFCLSAMLIVACVIMAAHYYTEEVDSGGMWGTAVRVTDAVVYLMLFKTAVDVLCEAWLLLSSKRRFRLQRAWGPAAKPVEAVDSPQRSSEALFGGGDLSRSLRDNASFVSVVADAAVATPALSASRFGGTATGDPALNHTVNTLAVTQPPHEPAAARASAPLDRSPSSLRLPSRSPAPSSRVAVPYSSTPSSSPSRRPVLTALTRPAGPHRGPRRTEPEARLWD